MTDSPTSESGLPGITLLPFDEQQRLAARRKQPPHWQRDPNLRSANPFGRAITYISDIAVFDVVGRYLVAKPYADWRAARPAPSYGYYEDDFCRLVFQYVQADNRDYLIGRSDIAVDARPPTYDVEEYLARFREVPLASVPTDVGQLAAIRQRIKSALEQFHWPSGTGLDVVRDALPGEIIQSEDRE